MPIKQSVGSKASGGGDISIFGARVISIILDNKSYPQEFAKNGKWSAVGSVFFSKLNESNASKSALSNNIAKPLFPNSSVIPLKNEVIYIIPLPNNNVQSDVNDVSYYYFQPINIWNSVHHNAIPDPVHGPSTVPASQTQNNQQTTAGNPRVVNDSNINIDLGHTFSEKIEGSDSIRNLQPFSGDVIHQGRWGQSLRFGSTVKNSNPPNPWSKDGEDGDPITILRNGQHEESNDPWIPQVEDINLDPSSVYLTTTQKIPIEVASKSYKSYQSAPESTNLYTGDQIILNSGRLLFNSKVDSILLSANTTINLNSVDSVNIDSPVTVIQSPEIYLGDLNATEPVILGDIFLTDFSKLAQNLVSLSTGLVAGLGGNIGGTLGPNGAVLAAASQLQVNANQMVTKIEKYKSKVSKSK
jgi:hypothetical protein